MSRAKVTTNPVTWAEVGEDNNDEWILSYANNREHDHTSVEYLDDLEDPLGLKAAPKIKNKASRRRNTYENNEKWDLSQDDFDATLYLATEYKETSMEELRRGLDNLEQQLSDRQKRLKVLVQDNFNRFVGCKDTLDELHQQMNEQHYHLLIQELDTTLKGVKSKATATFDNLITRQQEIDSIRSVLSILTRVKFKFIFSLPSMMKADMEKKDYDKVVFHYKKVVVWLADTQVSMFRKVLHQADNIIKELKKTLFASLDNPSIIKSKLEDEEKTIRLLVSLRSSHIDEQDDPAWYCINNRYIKIKELLNKAINGMSESNSLNTESHSTRVIRRLCSIIQELIPDFWSMAKSFYNGDYHTGLTEQEYAEIDERYSEEKFLSLLKSLIQIYVQGVRKHFFGEQLSQLSPQLSPQQQQQQGGEVLGGLLPSESVSGLVRSNGSRKRHGAYIQETILRRRNSKQKKNTFSIREWEQDDQSKNKSSQDKKFKEKFPPQLKDDEQGMQSTETAEDDDKEKVKAVMDCTTTLRNLKMSWEISGPVFQLLDEMTAYFLQNTFAWALHEMKRLYAVESWEITDNTLMVTSLPYHFTVLTKTAFSELKGVIETDDENILKEIEKNFMECLNSFADNMHYLAFEHNQIDLRGTEDWDNDFDDLRSQNARLLIILNNCSTMRTKIIPDLIKRYRAQFKLPLPTPDSLKDSTITLLEQLEAMVMNKYLKSKINLISSRIKAGILLEGFNFARSQPYQGIRDYVIDVLIHMVFVHEELHRISPTLVNKMLSLLLEFTYQSYIKWIEYIDQWSLYGKLQVGLELQFIDKITETYKTKYSQKLYDILDGILDFKNILDPKKDIIPVTVKTMCNQIIDKRKTTTEFLFQCFKPDAKK